MPPGLLAFVFALLLAGVDWIAVGLHQKDLEYIFKPAALIAIIIGAYLLRRGPHDEWQSCFFLVGLLLSLVGDIFLMLPGEGFFLPGLFSFLLAHLCYIAGLNSSLPAGSSLLLLLPVAMIGGILYSRIAAGLNAAAQTSLLVPVGVYSLVISVMLFSAWATLGRADWTTPRRALVIVGASLFFISDAMLAWNRFVTPFTIANLAVIVTYHLGQLALARSMAE